MNIRLTRDEFNDVIMAYIIELAKTDGKLTSEGTLVYSPSFDYFLTFIYNKPVGGKLGLVYNRLPAKSKLAYRRLMSRIKDTNEVVITL